MKPEIHILPDHDVNYLDDILMDNHFNLKVVPASVLRDIPIEHLAVWCHHQGVYGLPTQELIDWLRGQIIAPAIEIGAGNGAIGRALGIPITDSCIMRDPLVGLYYKLGGQPTTEYPADIVKMEAMDAIRHYKPATIIGCWVTCRYKEEEHERGGSIHGVNEEFILKNVKKYIVIGNQKVHCNKKILGISHKEYKFPWLYSRSLYRSKDIIYVWEGIGHD